MKLPGWLGRLTAESEDDPWPQGGYLVHPGIGLVPYRAQPLPLEERDIPPDFWNLPEDEDDEWLEAMRREVFAWALRHGANRVDVSALTAADKEAAHRAGLVVRNRRGDFTGPFNAAAADELLAIASPERLWVWAPPDRLIAYVHETWYGGVVVQGTEPEVDDLRTRL